MSTKNVYRAVVWVVLMSSLTGVVSSRAKASDESDTTAAIEAELASGASASLVVIGAEDNSYATYGRYRGRAHNVELAASLLDGAVVAPGAELSFNQRVGLRTEARGFRNAPVIANGRLRTGVGGGVCQVATSLNVASLQAGLEVVDRRAHSFPSHYVAPGLDATVVDQRVDFRVRNPHRYPVTVRAKARDGQLVVMVLGAEHRAVDTLETLVLRHIDAPQQVVVDPTLAPGEQVVTSEGREGLIVQVTRRTAAGTLVTTDRVRYAPQPHITHTGTH